MTPPLGPEGFAELVPVSRETLARLGAYAELLTRWSARINLVGRDTLPDLWRRHFLDSAQLHRFFPESTRSLIDLGSGAGLPGLVLAILGVPGVELVEADSRKAAFLREAARVTGTEVTIRPIRPEDEPAMVRFHETLSERSVYLRYFHLMNLEQRTTHERLTRICFIDYDSEMALVAEHRNPDTGESEILGVARMMKLHGSNDAEVAVLISDRWQGRGLGSKLLALLCERALTEGVWWFTAQVASDNHVSSRLVRAKFAWLSATVTC